MTNNSTWMMIAVVVVAFIAGYAVISFAIRKLKEGAGRTGEADQDKRGPEPTSKDD